MKEWTTSYPTSSDVLLTAQPDLSNSTSQGACNGDPLRSSFLHTLRDKLQAVCNIVGADAKPAGSLRKYGDLIPDITDPVGNAIITGSLIVTGSSVSITGSLYVSGNLTVQGYDVIRFGTTPTGLTSSYGIGTINHTGSAFAIYSSRTNGAGNESLRFSANISGTVISDDHIICNIGWMNSGPNFTGSWYIKNRSIETAESSSAEIIGTLPDAASSIGVILGSSASYVAAGSKLLSIQNRGQEREAVYYDGTRYSGISNYGSYSKDTYYSDIISITGSTLYSAHYDVPPGASIIGVGVRILSSFQTASVMAVGINTSGGFAEYWGNSMGYAAGVTNSTASLKTTYLYCPTSSYVCISSSVLQGNTTGATGSVRVECYYHVAGVPTS